MREKLRTKLKLEVELNFRKIAGVLSSIYSQGEQKKCLSQDSQRKASTARNAASRIRAPGSLLKSVPTVKARLIIYLNF